jgi:hypothetical protein
METKPRKLYIVRLYDKQSDPMVGEICGSGQVGTICWDPELRKFYPGTHVLVNKNGYEIIERK